MNIRCRIGIHKYQYTDNPRVKKCARCGAGIYYSPFGYKLKEKKK